jgi:tight adherence protein B
MTDVWTGVPAALAAAAAMHLLVGGIGRTRPGGDRVALRPGAAGALAGAGGVAASVALLDGSQVVLAVVALAVVAAAARDHGRRRQVAAAERRADLVLASCEGLASDLRAGQPPLTALAAAADDWPELAPAAAAARLGADVPAALRALAARPGAAQLRVVAAAWQVAHRSGAGLAGALSMAADHLRDDRATARVVATEMAAAQATARLLAVLPIAVLLLGNGLGGDPVGFLLGTPPGLVCLCVGLALEYAGLCWLARIADQVTGRRRR